MPFPYPRGRALLSSLLIWCALLFPFRFARASETALFATSTTPSSTILIGEMQWSGSSRSTADEWLELWNVGNESVQLSGWSLVGASENPIYFSSQIIAPQQTLLVANYSATTTDKTLLTNQTVAIATSSLSLSNDHLLIELYDATGVKQDFAGTGTKPPAGASSPTNTSMIRTASNTGWTWRTATSTFFVGAPDLGTPGVCDECQPFVPSLSDSEITDVVEEVPEPLEELPDYIEPLLEQVAEDEVESLPKAATSTPVVYETPTSTESISVTSTNEMFTLETPIEEPSAAQPTSTPAIDVAVTTTTIEIATSTAITPTSTEGITPAASQAPTSSPVPITQPVISSVTAPTIVSTPLPDLALNEFLPSPLTNDQEWIEFLMPFGISSARYIGWRVEADNKLVFRFTTTTIQITARDGDYLVATWKGSRLKNTGALIQLKRTDGTIVQEVRYGTSTKGAPWIWDPLSNNWIATHHPTPAATNIYEAVPVTLPKVPTITLTTKPAATIELKHTPSEPTQSVNVAKQTAPMSDNQSIKSLATATNKKRAAKDEAVSRYASSTAAPPATKKIPKSRKTTIAKKPASKKSLVIPTSVTHFEQIPSEQLTPRVRVRLQGIVGSTVGVFGKQRYVLLAPDGRGLLVKATADQPSPALGDTIEITGLIFANDDGVQLQMEKGDTWKHKPLQTTSTARLVDWNAPGIEDQWSLTKIQGLVTDSRASGIVLETQVGEVTITMKTIIGYRAQRVKNGDTVEVLGIFDGRNGQWKIQPSKASDITILHHPEPEKAGASVSPSSTKLPWNAIGIAVGSISAVEGIRRWLEKRKNTLQAKGTPATILGA